MIQKETREEILYLRIGRGVEFYSHEFKFLCEEKEIKRQLIEIYAPRQNGVAERKNKTLMNMVRSMLARRRIPKMFWPETVN